MYEYYPKVLYGRGERRKMGTALIRLDEPAWQEDEDGNEELSAEALEVLEYSLACPGWEILEVDWMPAINVDLDWEEWDGDDGFYDWDADVDEWADYWMEYWDDLGLDDLDEWADYWMEYWDDLGLDDLDEWDHPTELWQDLWEDG